MNHRFWLTVAAIGLVLAAGPAAAYGQERLSVNVPFPFIATGKTHPAGEYQLSFSDNQTEMTLTPAKGAATVALVTSRLAALDSAAHADRLVFDKVGNTYYLSEVWLAPGTDGFLMHATKETHTHQVIKVGRKAK